MSQSYRAAVDFAVNILRGQFRDGKLQSYNVEPTEFLYVFGLPILNHFDDHPLCGSHYTGPEYAFRFLYMHAGTDKGAFDIAVRWTTSKLLRNEPLSLEESQFAGLVLAGKMTAPPAEGKRLAQTFGLNVQLVMLATTLVPRFGLKAMRNDESEAHESACDAVSDALSELGHAKSWRAIKELLIHDSSARVREIAAQLWRYIENNQRETRETEINSLPPP